MNVGFRLSSAGNDKLRADRDKMCEALAYESPIEAMIAEASNSFDDGVFRAVLRTDIEVNKEELLKALQYDRGQYDKGYAVGVKEFARRLKKPISKCRLTAITEKETCSPGSELWEFWNAQEVEAELMLKSIDRIEKELTEVER